jgi:hypothetical protein
MKNSYDAYVDPHNKLNLDYWSRKWNVDHAQIRDAILHTGSLQPSRIKEWIRKDDLLYHPLDGAKYLMKKTLDAIF